jgi:hypothetical protein
MKILSLLLLLFLFSTTLSFAQNLSARRKKLDSIFRIQENLIKEKIEENLKDTTGKSLFSEGGIKDYQARDIALKEQLRTLDTRKLLTYRRDELDTLLGKNQGNYMVTPSNFNKIIQNKFETLSGTEIKNGKYYGSSVSVDSKSVTVNLSFKPSKTHEFYILPTIGGTSNDGFTTVITGDKYSKTITGGLNFIFLSGNDKSQFKADAARQLHNDLKLIRYHFTKQDPNPDTVFFQKQFKVLDDQIVKAGPFIFEYFKGTTNADVLSPADLEALKAYRKASDTLVKAKLLPKGFDTLTNDHKLVLINKRQLNDELVLALTHYLDTADQVQQVAAFSSQRIGWWGGGIKLNQADYNIQAPSTATLVNSFSDNYFSANVSWTYMKLLSNGNHFYFSPTYTIQNPHNFNTNSQLHAEVFQDYPIGSTTTQKISKDLTFYPSVPGRLFTNYLLLPIAYYFTKLGAGLELDYKYGHNDPENDNEDISLGVLIPIQNDKTTLVVEPIAKVQMLNQKITAFWEHNCVLGVNVAVAIPKSFFSK